MESLQDIGLRFNTDKSWDHFYMDFYEKNIEKEKVKKFLEIGIYNGESIRTWKEWFPKETCIEGWDVINIPKIDGCDLREVDQTDRTQMNKNITGIYDIILDDGAHTMQSIQTSFSFLFKYSKIYIIEDLHAAWWGDHYKKNDDVSTIDLLDELKNNKRWNSKYSFKEESDYIEQNAEIVDLFYRGERNNPLSMTCIIKNTKNLT